MSNENKPETPVTGDAGAAVAGGNDAPAVNTAGIDDQSIGAATGESAAANSQPESGGDAQQTDETPVPAPAPQPEPEVVNTPAQIPPPPPGLQQAAPSIAPTPDAPKAGVVQELPSSSIAGITAYENVNRLLAEVPKSKHGIIHFMVEYARDMAPRRPVPDGAIYQTNLYRQLHALSLIHISEPTRRS